MNTKDIFEYPGPDGPLFGDPLAIQRRLDALLDGDAGKAFEAFAEGQGAPALEAGDRLAAAACEAFRLGRPFDPKTGEGVTERQWTAALYAYWEWLEKNASPAANSPT